MSGEISISDKVDRDFVFQLATRGYVRVLSLQVVIEGESVDLTGIKIPDGVSIDWIGARATKDEFRPRASVTFNFDGVST
jgi:hypothetical protein